MNIETYNISIVNYLNTLPFQYGIAHSPIKEKIILHLDVPSECALKLKEGVVDIGLVPVAMLAELKDYYLISDFCIGANGKVDSVKLYSDSPLHLIRKILLDYQSQTSVNLVKILAREYWKINVRYEKAGPGFENHKEEHSALVIIGDRTFTKKNQFLYEYDLAEEWNKFTGLPFVFAAWVSLKPVPKEFIERFNTALAYGLQHIPEALTNYISPAPYFDPEDYLNNKISYNLDHKKLQALDKFLEYLILQTV